MGFEMRGMSWFLWVRGGRVRGSQFDRRTWRVKSVASLVGATDEMVIEPPEATDAGFHTDMVDAMVLPRGSSQEKR